MDKLKVRNAEGITLVEGLKEVEMALLSDVEIQAVYFVESLVDQKLLRQIQNKFPNIPYYELMDSLFAKSSYRSSSGGILCIVKTKKLLLKDLILPPNPLVLILEGLEKPGNLGAILRTADAAAVDAVICCDLPGDVYNPNTIRASLGTVFTVPIAVSKGNELRTWLKEKEIKTLCSNLHQAESYHSADYCGPTAIVMGTEATGVSEAWIKFAVKNIKIPMLGKIDSMNVSVATAILVYEAKRQRSLSSQ